MLPGWHPCATPAALLVVTGLCASHVCAQDPDYVLRALPAAAPAGGPVEVRIEGDLTDTGVVGYAFGLRHDPGSLAALAVESGDTIAALEPDFIETEIFPDGVTIAVVFFDAGLVWLPTGLAHDLHRVTYGIAPAATGPLALDFAGNLGSPIVEICMVPISSGHCVLPVTVGGSISVGTLLLRGDGNGDRSRDIADPVWILTWLHYGGAVPPCLDAADGNDDGVVDIADAIFLLAELFGRGDPTLPTACWIDPTADPIGCAVPSCP